MVAAVRVRVAAMSTVFSIVTMMNSSAPVFVVVAGVADPSITVRLDHAMGVSTLPNIATNPKKIVWEMVVPERGVPMEAMADLP